MKKHKLEIYSKDGQLVTMYFNDKESKAEFIEQNAIKGIDGFYELI